MLTFAQIRKGFKAYRSKPISKASELTQPIKGMTIGVLENICGGERGRKIVLMWLFNDMFDNIDTVTTKVLSPADWFALYRWVQPYKTSVGKYGHREGLEIECANIWYFQARKIGDIVEHENVPGIRT